MAPRRSTNFSQQAIERGDLKFLAGCAATLGPSRGGWRPAALDARLLLVTRARSTLVTTPRTHSQARLSLTEYPRPFIAARFCLLNERFHSARTAPAAAASITRSEPEPQAAGCRPPSRSPPGCRRSREHVRCADAPPVVPPASARWRQHAGICESGIRPVSKGFPKTRPVSPAYVAVNQPSFTALRDTGHARSFAARRRIRPTNKKSI